MKKSHIQKSRPVSRLNRYLTDRNTLTVQISHKKSQQHLPLQQLVSACIALILFGHQSRTCKQDVRPFLPAFSSVLVLNLFWSETPNASHYFKGSFIILVTVLSHLSLDNIYNLTLLWINRSCRMCCIVYCVVRVFMLRVAQSTGRK